MKLKHKINGKKKKKWNEREEWKTEKWNGVELSDIEYSRLDF